MRSLQDSIARIMCLRNSQSVKRYFAVSKRTPFFKAQAICFLSSFGYCHVRNSGHRIHRHFMTSCSSQGKKDSSGKSGMSCIRNDVIDHESKVKKPKRNKYQNSVSTYNEQMTSLLQFCIRMCSFTY